MDNDELLKKLIELTVMFGQLRQDHADLKALVDMLEDKIFDREAGRNSTDI